MTLAELKTTILGKWKSIERPGLIVEFKDENRFFINTRNHPFGYIYTISIDDNLKLAQITAIEIGLSIAFITEISQSKLVIANLTGAHHEPLQINANREILSSHEIFNFVRE